MKIIYNTTAKFLILLTMLFYVGCTLTPRGVFYKDFDPRRISVISVGQFTTSSGNAISDYVKNLMIQNLLARNFTVKEVNSEDVDYVLLGSVTKFLPEKKFLVYTGTNKQQVMLGGPLTEISGSNVYNIGTAFGVSDGEIVVTNATVGVSARLVEKRTGNVVWSSSFSYEALTADTAAEIVANYLITSLTGLRR